MTREIIPEGFKYHGMFSYIHYICLVLLNNPTVMKYKKTKSFKNMGALPKFINIEKLIKKYNKLCLPTSTAIKNCSDL